MARIVLGAYMVRYPLGGMLSTSLQWLVGLQRLGHEVFVVEKSGWPNSCFDPSKGVMSDDCSYGTATLNALLVRFGLEDRWCYVDAVGRYHGLSRDRVEAVFATADLFIDGGTHGAWIAEAGKAGLRVLVDGEPGFNQMKMAKRQEAGETLPTYGHYYTVGRNIANGKSTAPTVGRQWRPIFHPVVVELYPFYPVGRGAPFTTVMNWQSHGVIEFGGRTFGQKDVEFEKFVDLPRRTTVALEIAVSGRRVPLDELAEAGWRVRDAHEVTVSYDSFGDYIRRSAGEFSVCKNVFVATNSGWFSDRSAAYLASGRPVVLQDTGFSEHLPCGRGLWAVATVEEAAAAIDEIAGDYDQQSKWARKIAAEYLDARVVLREFLRELGL